MIGFFPTAMMIPCAGTSGSTLKMLSSLAQGQSLVTYLDEKKRYLNPPRTIISVFSANLKGCSSRGSWADAGAAEEH